MDFPLTTILKRQELDAVFVSNLVNVRYLTGFAGTAGYVVISSRRRWFLTDSRYLEQAAEQLPKNITILDIRGGVVETLKKIIKNSGLRRLGFESDTVTHAFHARLRRGLKGITLVPWTEATGLRLIKTEGEIKYLQKAAEINRTAFIKILPYLKPGTTEKAVAEKLERSLRSAGAERLAFDIIVASGKRGARPHGVATGKKIRAGELVTIDFGGGYRGYQADETITVGVGKLTKKQKLIHDIVREAQNRAVAVVRPGIPAKIVDRAARDYIAEKGYGKYFGHSLGHGVGLEIHEPPVLSPDSRDILRPGMVFTIEPGIYIPGWGGVRIEDMFVLTAGGIKRLTRLDKELRSL